MLDAAIEADPELGRRVRVELYRRLGYFPTESSEHGSEYLPWFLRDDGEIERFRLEPGEYVRRSRRTSPSTTRSAPALASGAPLPDERAYEYAPRDHPLDGHRHAARHLRQRPQPRADRRAAAAGAVEVPVLVDRTGLRPTVVRGYPRAAAPR